MPGIGVAIEGAMQQAPQPGRQSIGGSSMAEATQCAAWAHGLAPRDAEPFPTTLRVGNRRDSTVE
jgi:hypothetical protein